MKKIIFIFVCLLFCSGCYNYNELENLGIASSMLIDYVDKEYNITIEINENNKPKTYEGTGKTISEALENSLLKSEKALYLAHLNAVMFTKEVDVQDMVSYFIREPKINTTFYFLLAESKEIYSDGKDDIGLKIFNILKRHNVYNFFQISQFIFNSNRDLILPFINKDGDITSGYIFTDNVPILEISYDEVEIYKLLDNILNSNIIADGYNGYIEVNINEAKTKYEVSKKIVFDSDIDATVTQYNNDLNLDDVKDIKRAEELLNRQIKRKSEDFIEKIKLYQSDIFGLDVLIKNKYHELNKHWYEYDFEINVDTHINKKGLLLS